MSIFTNIYIVAVENLGEMLQNRRWYWDRSEALDVYNEAVNEDENTRIVTLYSIDMEDVIEERVDSLMANRHSRTSPTPLEELRSSRAATAAPEPEYSNLRYDEGSTHLLIERTLGGEFWQYRIIKRSSGWHVRELETFGGGRIGAVYLNDPDAVMPEYEFEKEVDKALGSRASLREAVIALLELEH